MDTLWLKNGINKTSWLLVPMISILLTACESQPDSSKSIDSIRPVKAMQITLPVNVNNRSFSGRAKATQEVNLSFNVDGTINELPVNVGDHVTKGALIAKLDQREFIAKVNAAKAETMRDEQNYLRAKSLVGQQYISEADYELLSAKFEMSKANLDLAQKTLSDSTLIAPFEGKISEVFVKNFQTVKNQESIARLLDISKIEMVLQIPENAISLIPYVTNIKVEFDAFPSVIIPATIIEVSNEASAETGTYPVTLSMEQPKDIDILPGMAGKAKGEVSSTAINKNKITVPISAVLTLENKNQSFVFVIDLKTQQVHKRQVKLGDLSHGGITIVSGLTVGEWIVSAGVHSLSEGDHVRILSQEEK